MNRTIGLISTNYSVAGYEEMTDKRPPACIPFGGRYRLMDFALSNLANARITTVGFLTPYYYRSILDHMGAGKPWGLDRKSGGLFVLPGSVYGFRDDHGRFLLRDMLRNDAFLERGDGDYVLCSDCSYVYNADYQALITHHELSSQPVTLFYKRVDASQARPGYYIELDENGRVTSLRYAKSGECLLLNCFVANRTFLLRFLRNYRTLGHMDFLEALGMNLETVSVGSYAFEGYVGFTEGMRDYMNTSLELLSPQVRRELFSRQRPIATKVHDEPPSAYLPGAVVRNSAISAGSIIEGTVENSILFREVHVEKGAVVRNCVIMENGTIHAGASLSWTVCDKGVTIGEGVTVSGTPEHPCLLPKGKTI